MNRRQFLRALGIGGAAAVALASTGIDPEALGWKPGKAFSLPAVRSFQPTEPILFRAGDVITIDGHWGVNPVTGLYTSRLQQFVVTADIQSGYSAITLYPNFTISPSNAAKLRVVKC